MATTASTVDVDGDSFGFSHDGYSQVINHGNITVSDGGFAILAAPYVANSGVIKANLGQIHLASAQAYTLDLRGDGLITFTVDAATIGDIEGDGKAFGIDNTGTLQARSGEVVVTATTVAKVVNSVVNLGGVVDADAFTIGADGGTVLASSAGDLHITGALHADGGVDGDGGEDVTWADGTNHFETGATIAARGGADAGDGGFIEVSGTEVRFRGTADASAANGRAGTMLLDPTDLTIADGAGVDSAATVYEENIEAMSVAGTNVVLEADNSITMEDLGDDELLGGSGDISLRTTGNDGGTGTIDMAAGDTIVTTTGSIIIDANGSAADI
jgi:hypothetical protein